MQACFNDFSRARACACARCSVRSEIFSSVTRRLISTDGTVSISDSDLRLAKWVSGVGLQGGNPDLLMSALGQKQTLRPEISMSAFSPKADIDSAGSDVRFGAEPQTYIVSFVSSGKQRLRYLLGQARERLFG